MATVCKSLPSSVNGLVCEYSRVLSNLANVPALSCDCVVDCNTGDFGDSNVLNCSAALRFDAQHNHTHSHIKHTIAIVQPTPMKNDDIFHTPLSCLYTALNGADSRI